MYKDIFNKNNISKGEIDGIELLTLSEYYSTTKVLDEGNFQMSYVDLIIRTLSVRTRYFSSSLNRSCGYRTDSQIYNNKLSPSDNLLKIYTVKGWCYFCK